MDKRGLLILECFIFPMTMPSATWLAQSAMAAAYIKFLGKNRFEHQIRGIKKMISFKTEFIKVDITSASIAVCSIVRPQRRNALTRETRLELTSFINDAARNSDIRGIVLASYESSFSAGQDLAEARDFVPQYISEWIDEHMGLYKAIVSYPRPILAAIEGCCVGAGLQTALLCDMRICSNDAFFAMPELDDAIPCILGIWALWDVIGRTRTTEMVLTNCKIEAKKALDWGIVNKVADQAVLLETTLQLTDQLASKSTLAFKLTKERLMHLMLQQAEELSVHASYAHITAFSSGEPKQAMNKFLSRKQK